MSRKPPLQRTKMVFAITAVVLLILSGAAGDGTASIPTILLTLLAAACFAGAAAIIHRTQAVQARKRGSNGHTRQDRLRRASSYQSKRSA